MFSASSTTGAASSAPRSEWWTPSPGNPMQPRDRPHQTQRARDQRTGAVCADRQPRAKPGRSAIGVDARQPNNLLAVLIHRPYIYAGMQPRAGLHGGIEEDGIG